MAINILKKEDSNILDSNKDTKKIELLLQLKKAKTPEETKELIKKLKGGDV